MGTDATASFLSVRPTGYGFRAVTMDGSGYVTALRDPARADIWINGGYFILRPEVFEVMRRGEELVEAPFARLAADGRLATLRYDGFWAPVDTLRDVQRLEDLAESGAAPWMVWIQEARPAAVAHRNGGAGADYRSLRRR